MQSKARNLSLSIYSDENSLSEEECKVEILEPLGSSLLEDEEEEKVGELKVPWVPRAIVSKISEALPGKEEDEYYDEEEDQVDNFINSG
jgi:hypothetical protein